MWVLWTQPRTPGRIVSACNLWAISPAPSVSFLKICWLKYQTLVTEKVQNKQSLIFFLFYWSTLFAALLLMSTQKESPEIHMPDLGSYEGFNVMLLCVHLVASKQHIGIKTLNHEHDWYSMRYLEVNSAKEEPSFLPCPSSAQWFTQEACTSGSRKVTTAPALTMHTRRRVAQK